MLSVDGLASGIDTSSLIAQIMQLQRRPAELLQARIDQNSQRQGAFLSLSARLLNLQLTSRRLSESETYRGVTVNSSAEDVLTVSASSGVPPGAYTFRVARLASTSQYVSSRFADTGTSAVGAGTLKIELGAGFVNGLTELDELNGGAGVTRGSFRITDRAGGTALIDLSTAITLDDVLQLINDETGIQVTASISGTAQGNAGQAILLTDTSAGAGTLTVEEASGGSSAAELGILGSGVGATLAGASIRTIGSATRFASLGDGLGLRGNGTTADDITITRKDGVTFGVDLDSLSTVGDLLDAVNTAAANTAGGATLTINGAGTGFVLTDSTGGGGALTVADGALSSAATDLGLAGTTAGAAITGTRVLAGINDMLFSTLNGGGGASAGSISVTDRAGATTVIDLSSALTLQDALRLINDSAANVTASIDTQGSGLLIRDTSGGSGTLTIAESGGGSTAADLGILGSSATGRLDGTDLNPLYMHANTLLSSMNGGRGVAEGAIRITDSSGISFTVTISNDTTMADVVRDLEGAASVAGSNLTVGFNSTGNGLLLTSAGGAGTLEVEEVSGGTTARDLGIAGSADSGTPTIINGSFEKTITISATDTLEDVLDAIEELDLDVAASIVNDGSALAPYRLNLISGRSGQNSRLLLDTSGGTNLGFTRTAEGKDGVVFYGESSQGSTPVLVRSNTNTYTDIVDGMTITALQASDTPVQVTVERDNTSLVDLVEDMIKKVNEVIGEVNTITAFNVETEERGVLLGDGTANNLKRNLLGTVIRSLSGVDNEISLAAQIGIRIANGKLSFDRGELEAAIEANPEAVESFFAAKRPFTNDTELEDFNDGRGVRHKGGEDFRITLRDGSTVDVDTSEAETLRDVIAAINEAGGGSVVASFSTTANSIVLTDNTAGATTFRVTALNSAATATDLGIDRSADSSGGGTITGDLVDLSGNAGMAAKLTDYLEELVNTEDGVLQTRSDGIDKLNAELQERMKAMEERLASREEVLRRQFAQLEEIVANSQATMARLTAQLATLGGAGR